MRLRAERERDISRAQGDPLFFPQPGKRHERRQKRRQGIRYDPSVPLVLTRHKKRGKNKHMEATPVPLMPSSPREYFTSLRLLLWSTKIGVRHIPSAEQFSSPCRAHDKTRKPNTNIQKKKISPSTPPSQPMNVFPAFCPLTHN